MYCVIGTAGHVDHGKTTLVKALTGTDTDRLKEEKERGLSIELGFAHFTTPASDETFSDLTVSIIDVPGHEKFLRTMLAGTTGIDMLLLVVAADDGIMPQTREHLEIVRLLGVRDALVAITKVDAVDAHRVDQVRNDLREFFKETPFEAAPVIPVSSVTGAGIAALKDLIIEKCRAIRSKRSGTPGGPFFRLPIDRSFPVKGFGAVVTGTVASGICSVGDSVSLFSPAATVDSIRVRSIQSAFKELNKVSSGARAALNLKGINSRDNKTLRRGALVADPGLVAYVANAASRAKSEQRLLVVDCALEFSSLSSPLKNRGIKDGTQVLLHHLTGESVATLRFPDRQTKNPGESAFGRLIVRDPLMLMRGDSFILRGTTSAATLGGGRVLLPYFDASYIKRLDRVNFTALESGVTETMLGELLGHESLALEMSGLEYLLNVAPEDILNGAKSFLRLPTSGRYLFNTERLACAKVELEKLLGEFHQENPSEAGINEMTLCNIFSGEKIAQASICRAILEMMIDEGVLTRQASLVRLATHRARLSASVLEVEKALISLFEETSFNSVKASDIDALSFAAKETREVLGFLLSSGSVVKLKDGVYISSRNVSEAETRLRAFIETSSEGRITVKDFRDVLGTGRKLAIEILEYFDIVRVTLRQGDFRTLR